MVKTIGDYWRECSNEKLASNMVDFLLSLLKSAGIPIENIDMLQEYNILLDFFDTEFEDEDGQVVPTSNGFSYIN